VTILGLEPDDATALIDGRTGEHVSYRRLVGDAERILTRLGPDRSLVFLLSRNDRFTALTYAAALLGGHPIALLDGSRPEEELAALVETYRPAALAGPDGTATRVARHLVRATVSVDSGELVLLDRPGQPELHPDLALLLSTSGTTGSRKFVRLSTANLQSNAVAIVESLGLTDAERPVTSLPLHYTFGLSVLNSHWLAGATVVLSGDSVVMRPFWDSFRGHACTSLAGVPYTYAMLERLRFRDMELPSLTSLQQAGGALDRRLTALYAEHMASRGGRFHVMYGQTEATARMAVVPFDRLRDKLGSAGVAIPGGRFRIGDPQPGREGGPAAGEVIYEGPNVMLGYAEGPGDLALGDELGGVLATGDIGYLDDDGYLFLVGRSKRIGKVFGLRVNLDEVEAMLREHGPAAVVGGEDTLWAFCAFGSDGSVGELADEFSRRLRLHRSALHFRRVAEIPTLESGKVDYQQVQRWVTG
jgi:acyl-CoA synthetase (AMP-forming)/AMP-acid ligase II